MLRRQIVRIHVCAEGVVFKGVVAQKQRHFAVLRHDRHLYVDLAHVLAAVLHDGAAYLLDGKADVQDLLRRDHALLTERLDLLDHVGDLLGGLVYGDGPRIAHIDAPQLEQSAAGHRHRYPGSQRQHLGGDKNIPEDAHAPACKEDERQQVEHEGA